MRAAHLGLHLGRLQLLPQLPLLIAVGSGADPGLGGSKSLTAPKRWRHKHWSENIRIGKRLPEVVGDVDQQSIGCIQLCNLGGKDGLDGFELLRESRPLLSAAALGFLAAADVEATSSPASSRPSSSSSSSSSGSTNSSGGKLSISLLSSSSSSSISSRDRSSCSSSSTSSKTV